MYRLVLRQHDGTHVRIQSEDEFHQTEIEQYESDYGQYVVDNSRPYYDNTVKHDAVAINVFET